MICLRTIIAAMLAITASFSTSQAIADSAMDDEALTRLSGSAAFRQFIDDMRPRALKSGINARLYDRTMAGLKPDPRVEKLGSNQPEFSTPIWQYINKRVNTSRITIGRKMKTKHARTIAAIEKRYGVDRHIFLAIWGMETNFGGYKGNMSIVRSLATMGYQGRRERFGRTQLIAALKILQRGDVSAKNFVGSWAGAMGHTQFIPTTYAAHAVDWTGDGKRDIWNSVADALASTANYLSRSGWRPGRPWGWEVKLPSGFDYTQLGPAGARTLTKWKKAGVVPARGGRYGVADETAQLILPAGAKGPAFLVTKNFKAILAYNNSTAYALAVGHLADRIRGGQGFVSPWPVNDRPLSRKQRIEMQQLLTQKGFSTGGVNGRIGKKTKAAIRQFQRKAGLPPDGYASTALLARLKR